MADVMTKKRAALHNLGCKVNAYETEAMEQMLITDGYEIVPFSETADVYVINTCSVTHIADRKSRQMIRRVRELSPDAVVIATGCYVQTASDTKSLPDDLGCDIIIGNNKKHKLIELLHEYQSSSKPAAPVSEVIDINDGVAEYETLSDFTPHEHTRAFLKIQDGCNQFCSYCIIPYARGRVRSRDISDISDEAMRLSKAGYREVVLTGIHVGSYDYAGKSLIDVVETVARVPGIERIRLSSVEPRIITEENVKRLSAIGKLCPHFHLSLQSGCDETLLRMNRRYKSDEYRSSVELLRDYFDDPAITTDVIVGFPGESAWEFEASYEFLESIGFYELHVFKYSKRFGTRAAVMPDQVSAEDKQKRSERLIALGDEMTAAYRRRHIGKRLSVLIEEPVFVDGQSFMQGFSKEYIQVRIPEKEGLSVGDITDYVYKG